MYVNSSLTPQVEHYHLFPKSLGQILHKFHVDELHLSFTQGRWWNELWGNPVYDAPVGLELYTWFDDQVSSERFPFSVKGSF